MESYSMLSNFFQLGIIIWRFPHIIGYKGSLFLFISGIVIVLYEPILL